MLMEQLSELFAMCWKREKPPTPSWGINSTVITVFWLLHKTTVLTKTINNKITFC
jgi:hypothetical protein